MPKYSKLICLFLIIAFTTLDFSPAFAQKFYKKKYAAQIEPGSKLLTANFNSTLEKTPEGKFIFKMYFPVNKQMTHSVTYKSKKIEIKDGPYEEYWDDGQLRWKGEFKENERVGEWIELFGSRSYQKGNYVKNNKEGEWLHLDSLMEKVSRSETFKNGELNGPVKYFDENGELEKELRYEKGEIVATVFDRDPPKEQYKIVEELPRFPGCETAGLDSLALKKCAEKKLLMHIYTNIKYPVKARMNGIQGTAIVQYNVSKTGQIEDIRVRRGISKSIAAECERVVSTMPVWIPGKQQGKAVKVQYNLPIRFKLE